MQPLRNGHALSRLAPQISSPQDAPAPEAVAPAGEDGGARVFLYPQDAISPSRPFRPARRGNAARSIVRPVAYVAIGVAVGLVYGAAIFGL